MSDNGDQPEQQVEGDQPQVDENGNPIEPPEPEEPRNFLKREQVLEGLSLI
jgi:hypothetical protein